MYSGGSISDLSISIEDNHPKISLEITEETSGSWFIQQDSSAITFEDVVVVFLPRDLILRADTLCDLTVDEK